MHNLQIIVGSTRPGRAADTVLPWVVRRANEHGTFDVEVLDLRDWPLPLFSEHAGSIGDRQNPTYSDPLVKAWNEKLKSGDAFVFITPEYNHSLSGVLKNAIDNVYVSWALRNKPAASLSYSGGIAGGARAIEHLALILVEAECVPLRNTVIIPTVGDAFDPQTDLPRDPAREWALQVMLDDLAWWADALGKARAQGELLPARQRTIRLPAGR